MLYFQWKERNTSRKIWAKSSIVQKEVH